MAVAVLHPTLLKAHAPPCCVSAAFISALPAPNRTPMVSRAARAPSMVVAVRANQSPTKVVEDLQQQARDFRIPEFSPPWAHQVHPAVEEAKNAADEWALYHCHTLVGSKRFSGIMESNITDGLVAGIYTTGQTWGLELAMEYFLFAFVMDDELLHRTNLGQASSSSRHKAVYEVGTAQICVELLLVMMSTFPREKALEAALERILAIDEKWELTKVRAQIEKFLAQAERHPGTVDFSDELAESISPITSAYRNIWKRATAVMPEEWSLRFAYLMQRDILSAFKEAQEGIPGLTPIPEYIQARREFGNVEPCLVLGELTEGIQVSSTMYYSPPMQRLVQATNDIICWHNDIYSFRKELLAGESLNLVHLISNREGCSYNRAAEIVRDMMVDRCKDLNLAAAELRQHAESEEKSHFSDSENAAKYILMCTNFISAAHYFHQRSSRFHKCGVPQH